MWGVGEGLHAATDASGVAGPDRATDNGGMSPSRRRLLLAVTLVGVLLLSLVAVLQRTGPAPVGVAQDVPGRVLLVPGYGGSTDSLEVLAAKLRAAGREVGIIALPGDGTGDLRESARVLDAATAGATSVDVVGYSAGGVTVRYWAKELGGARLARRIVTLGSPQHGTGIAALGATFTPGRCTIACQQLVPDSTLLRQLNRDGETPAGPMWLSLWTSQDETVTPPSSARLRGAVNVQLQDICPGLVVSHSDLPRDDLVGGIVLQALGVAPIRQPTDCAVLSAAGRLP